MSRTLCAKCGSKMTLGFLVDGQGRMAFRQAAWAPGPPEALEASFMGMKLYEEWALKLEEKDLVPISSWRCDGCGFLEFYATDPS